MTNEEKVSELLKDEDFLEELGKAESAEETQKLFTSKGAELSDEELAAVAGGAGPFGNFKDALGDGQIPLEQPRVSAVHI